jgi:hypothetical protein
LRATGIEGFAHRAAHNLTLMLDEAALINCHLARGDLARWSLRRVANNRMAGLVAAAYDVSG